MGKISMVKVLVLVIAFTMLLSTVPAAVSQGRPETAEGRPEPMAIKVDGNTGDWAGIAPLILDWEDDASHGEDVADITAVYMTMDSKNLYIRIDVKGEASRTGGDYTVFLDVDQNSETGWWTGAEYIFDAWCGKAYLRRYTGNPYWIDRYEVVNPKLPVAFKDHTMEASIPLKDLGYPEAMDVVVMAWPCDAAGKVLTYTVGSNHADIEVDGDFDDWAGVPYAYKDAVGDAPDNVDMTYCYIADNATDTEPGCIFFCVDITGDLSETDLVVFVDSDLNPKTGYPLTPWNIGAEDIAEFYDSGNPGGEVVEGYALFDRYAKGTRVKVMFLAGEYGHIAGDEWIDDGDRAPDEGSVSFPYKVINSSWLENPVTLDGEMSPGEWDEATPIDFTLKNVTFFSFPPLDYTVATPDLVKATLWVKNDAKWLYMFMNVSFSDSEVPDDEDDADILYYWDGTTKIDAGVLDYDGEVKDFYGEGGYTDFDTVFGGENNVEGAATYDFTCGCYYFEFRKELDSFDGYDAVLVPGHSYGAEPDDFMMVMFCNDTVVGGQYIGWETYAEAVRINLASCPWLLAPIERIHEEDFPPGIWETELESILKTHTTVAPSTSVPLRVDVARYSEAPCDYALEGDIGKYIDVRLNATAGVDNVTIIVHYTDEDVALAGMPETYLSLYYWDSALGVWFPCTHCYVDTEDHTLGGVDFSGRIIAFINATDTHPTVNDLIGAPFTIRAHSPPHPYVYPIYLGPGWNLISPPLIPEDEDIDTVLKPVIPTVTEVWTYDASRGTWLWAEVIVDARGRTRVIGSLRTIEDGKAYWIKASDEEFLPIEGYVVKPMETPPTYPVYEGWNLIGYKGVEPMKVKDYLGDVLSSTVMIVGYDPYSGMFYNLSPEDELIPGYGYWLYVTEDEVIVPPA